MLYISPFCALTVNSNHAGQMNQHRSPSGKKQERKQNRSVYIALCVFLFNCVKGFERNTTSIQMHVSEVKFVNYTL